MIQNVGLSSILAQSVSESTGTALESAAGSFSETTAIAGRRTFHVEFASARPTAKRPQQQFLVASGHRFIELALARHLREQFSNPALKSAQRCR